MNHDSEVIWINKPLLFSPLWYNDTDLYPFTSLTHAVSYPEIQQAQMTPKQPLGFMQRDNMAFWQNNLASVSVLNNAL